MNRRQEFTGPWLWISRILWILITALTVSMWYLAYVVINPPDSANFSFNILTPTGFFLIAGALMILGGRQAMVYITSLTLVLFGPYMISGVNNLLAEGSGIIAVLNALLVMLGVFLIMLFLFVFPNARFVPPRTKYLIPIGIIAFSAISFRDLTLGRTSLVAISTLMLVLFFGIGLQIYRYIKFSTYTERQQTKWVLLGLASLMLAVSIWFVGVAVMGLGLTGLSTNLAAIFVLFFPLTVAISVLRYRLYNIDVVIQKTLVYGLLTAVLVGVYFGSVVLIQSLLHAITGQQSSFAVVISTLVIAALFNPLRTKIQRFIDRRFYRRKYDAEQIAADFGISLRSEVNIEQLSEQLLKVVEETLHPTHLSIWLKDR